MFRESFKKVEEEMNKLERQADKYSDKAYDYAQQGKDKKSDYYDKQAEEIELKISGFADCLKMLGLGVWKECNRDTDYNIVWHIPDDDIERVI